MAYRMQVMPILNRKSLKKFTYLITGIVAIIASAYASLMATSIAMSIFILTIGFITRPIFAFMPDIFYALFLLFTFIVSLFVYAELMTRIVRFARKNLIKLLRIDKTVLTQLKRVDPFKAVWLWGYLLPILLLSIIAIPTKFT